MDDITEASAFLELVSYYRLRAYWRPFERDDNALGEHFFQDNLDFGRIKNLYLFDRKLRILLLDAIERIEVATRALWTNLMAEKYEAHGYLNKEYYKNEEHHKKNVRDQRKAFVQSKDKFINHYKETYTAPYLPPVWMAVELMSFGLLSKFLSNLKHRSDKNQIARVFELDEGIFTKFIYHLSLVRNVCAHHGRLWDRLISVPFIPQNTPVNLEGAIINDHLDNKRNGSEGVKLYNTLVMIDHLLGFIVLDNETDDWKQNLFHLIDDNPEELHKMGFPVDWRDRDIWRVE